MESVDNFKDEIEKTIGNFKQNLLNILSNISESKSELDEKHSKLNEKIEELRVKDNELEQFRKVSFIGAMNKQILEKDNEISILKQKVNHLKKELKKLQKLKTPEPEEEEELDVYEEEINGTIYYITDGDKNYIYERLENGEIGDIKLGEIKKGNVSWF